MERPRGSPDGPPSAGRGDLPHDRRWRRRWLLQEGEAAAARRVRPVAGIRVRLRWDEVADPGATHQTVDRRLQRPTIDRVAAFLVHGEVTPRLDPSRVRGARRAVQAGADVLW